MRTVLAAVSAMAVTTGQASILRGWLAIRKTATRQGKVLHVESGLPMSERNIVGIGGGGAGGGGKQQVGGPPAGRAGEKKNQGFGAPPPPPGDAHPPPRAFWALPHGARPPA